MAGIGILDTFANPQEIIAGETRRPRLLAGCELADKPLNLECNLGDSNDLPPSRAGQRTQCKQPVRRKAISIQHRAIIGLQTDAEFVGDAKPLLTQVGDQGNRDSIEVAARTRAVDDRVGREQLLATSPLVKRDVDCAVILFELHNTTSESLE